MDIKALPLGARCLVDANIIIYHLNNLSADCTDFFDRVIRQEAEAFVTTTIIAEVLHRTMLQEAISKGLAPTGKTLNYVKANPTIITHLTDYVVQVEGMLSFPLNVIEVTMNDITASHVL